MSTKGKINPWYISGFTEGEGCFAIIITKHKTKKTRRDVTLAFEIELRGDDRQILEMIKNRLKCGNIFDLKYERYGRKPHVKYVVRNQRDILYKIIPFFNTFPLKGKKYKDFLLFCEAAEIIKKKEHLSEEGIKRFEKIREFMNERRPFGA